MTIERFDGFVKLSTVLGTEAASVINAHRPIGTECYYAYPYVCRLVSTMLRKVRVLSYDSDCTHCKVLCLEDNVERSGIVLFLCDDLTKAYLRALRAIDDAIDSGDMMYVDEANAWVKSFYEQEKSVPAPLQNP